jgi:PAS domain S-box-containing protein
MNPPEIRNEKKRLEVLWDYDILDAPPDELLDEITRLAGLICETPIALISLVDKERQWFKSNVGLEMEETAREVSFCAHTIGGRDLFVVEDAASDARFAANPLVTAEPRIRFYAGAPLVTPCGQALGALCVIDRVPRQLRPGQDQVLRMLARQVMAHLELRRRTRDLGRVTAERDELDQARRLLLDRERELLARSEHTQRTAHVGSWEFNVESGLLMWSDEAFRIYGCEPGSFQPDIGQVLAMVHPDDRAGVQVIWETTLRDGVPLSAEHRILVAGGADRVVLCRGDVFLSPAGSVTRVVGSVQDITPLRHAEGALQRTERQFRSMIENAQDMLATVDAAGVIRFVSPAVRSTLGYAPGELVGCSFAEFIHPDDVGQTLTLLQTAFLDASRPHLGSFRFRHADGSWHAIETLGKVMAGEDPSMLIVNARDVTEKKRAEEMVRRSDERLKMALAGAQMGVWEWDVKSDALFWSDECFDICGMDRREMVFGDFIQLVSEDEADRLLGVVRQALSNRMVFSAEFRIRRPDGEARWISALGNGAYDEHGGPVRLLGIMQDITERKLATTMVTSQNRVLEHIATGASLKVVLEEIVLSVEDQLPNALCSLLLLDRDGERLRVAAAPSLSPEYNAAIDGVRIGPAVGSCGTAAFRRQTVIVNDISADPLWEGFRQTALQHGLRACWSVPVFSLRGGSTDPEVLGTFAVYYREPRLPDPQADRLIARAAHLARVAIEHSRAAQALRESEERLRLAAEAGQMGTWDRDLRTNRLFWSLNMERLMGFEPGTFPGTYEAFRDLIHPDDRAVFAAAQERAFAGDGNYQAELRFRCADGRVRWGYVRGQVFFDAQGSPERIVGVDMDITERKRAQEEAQRFVALSPAVLYARSVDESAASVNWVSENIIRLTGYTVAEARMAHWWRENVHPEDLARLVALRRKVDADDRQVAEYRFRHKNGKYVWLHDERRLARSASGQPEEIIGAWTNATERVQLQEQFRQAQKMEAIGQLAGGVAHDFNNILTIIHGNASMLLDPVISREDYSDSVRQIVQAAERAAGLTRQLLLFGRKQVMRPADIDLNEVVGNMTKMLQRILGEDVALRAEFAPDLPCVHADTGMIEQVILNLAVNSRDAMPGGGRLIITTAVANLAAEDIRHNLEARPGPMVHLSVTDTGSGIAPEHLPHIFEPFFTTKEVGKGTGLGLATVYGIVQQHRGDIRVTSEMGVGTTFHVYLPAVPRLATEPAIRPRTTSLPRGTETILIVEDEAAVRLLVTNLLQRCGYQVFVAPTAVQALQVWKENGAKIDLLLTDMVMPDGMSGRQLSDQLRAERPDLKVVYTSGYSPEAVGQGRALPPNTRFLQKPFDPFRLSETLRSLLDLPGHGAARG